MKPWRLREVWCHPVGKGRTSWETQSTQLPDSWSYCWPAVMEVLGGHWSFLLGSLLPPLGRWRWPLQPPLSTHEDHSSSFPPATSCVRLGLWDLRRGRKGNGTEPRGNLIPLPGAGVVGGQAPHGKGALEPIPRDSFKPGLADQRWGLLEGEKEAVESKSPPLLPPPSTVPSQRNPSRGA